MTTRRHNKKPRNRSGQRPAAQPEAGDAVSFEPFRIMLESMRDAIIAGFEKLDRPTASVEAASDVVSGAVTGVVVEKLFGEPGGCPDCQGGSRR